MLLGQLDYISIRFQLFNVLNIFSFYYYYYLYLYNYFIALYISQVSFHLGLVVRGQKRNRLGSFLFLGPGLCTRAVLLLYFEYMFHAIWKPRAVCRLRGHRFNELHARVCFGEITSKKTERIVMIL